MSANNAARVHNQHLNALRGHHADSRSRCDRNRIRRPGRQLVPCQHGSALRGGCGQRRDHRRQRAHAREDRARHRLQRTVGCRVEHRRHPCLCHREAGVPAAAQPRQHESRGRDRGRLRNERRRPGCPRRGPRLRVRLRVHRRTYPARQPEQRHEDRRCDHRQPAWRARHRRRPLPLREHRRGDDHPFRPRSQRAPRDRERPERAASHDVRRRGRERDPRPAAEPVRPGHEDRPDDDAGDAHRHRRPDRVRAVQRCRPVVEPAAHRVRVAGRGGRPHRVRVLGGRACTCSGSASSRPTRRTSRTATRTRRSIRRTSSR